MNEKLKFPSMNDIRLEFEPLEVSGLKFMDVHSIRFQGGGIREFRYSLSEKDARQLVDFLKQHFSIE